MQVQQNTAALAESNAAEMLQKCVLNLGTLPMLPEVAIKALATAKDPECSLKTLAGLIEQDPALATGILRLANSAFYRTGRSVESINNAVVRLGQRECQSLIITVSLRQVFHNIPVTKSRQRQALWQHSFTTAVVCRKINQHLNLGFAGQEFAAGLCHDVGRLLIAVGASPYFDLADPMEFKESPSVLAREQDILGTDHSQLGAWYSHLNELPETISHAIRYHHVPGRTPKFPELIGLVAVADHMANAIQRREDPEEYEIEANEGWQFAGPVWGDAKAALLADAAHQIMTDAAREGEGALTFR